MKKVFRLEDLDCANCAAKMEQAAKKTPGVRDCTVSFMTLKMNVEFEEGADVTETMGNVLKNCRRIERDCEIFF